YGKPIWQSAPQEGAAMCESFSPDGATLASGSTDHTVRLWDVATGNQKTKLEGHTDVVNCVSFSPGGAILASGSADHSVRVWDVVTGKQKLELQGHTKAVLSVSF